MSYSTEQGKVSRCPMSLTVIKMDYCANVFGEAPCTATGTRCYNTYKTCKDKPNFVKTTRDYDFVNNDAPRNATFMELNAKPYEKSIEFVGTELREDKTIPARATFVFMDEPDTDQGTDPYLYTRVSSPLDVPGTYWKKWIERNPYYKGRILEHYNGFDGIAKADFVKDFSGKILNITREGRNVKVECTDDIVDLSEKTHPFKTNIKIAEDLGACTEVKNQEDMLKLTAAEGDYALRIDFALMPLSVSTVYDEASTLSGRFYYQVVAYDANDNPIAICELQLFDASAEGHNKITDSWSAVTLASYYRVFRMEGDNAETVKYFQTTNLTFTDYGQSLFITEGAVPAKAARLFIFSGVNSFDLNNWTELTSPVTLLLTSVTGLESSGYIKIDDEIIFYNGITSLTLQNIARLQYKSKADTPHYNGTNIKLVTWKTAANGFAILEDLWLDAGTPAGRIDSDTLDTLAAAWTGINFSTKPIVKDTDAGKLTADLAWVMDIKYWVNEAGKLTVRRNDDETVDHEISDASNIVLDSKSIDYNQDEIFTRILFSYDRNDVTKSGSDKDNYSRLHVEVNADAEGPNMYNEELPLPVVTTWINDDCGTETEIEAYITGLLNKKLKRLVVTRPKLSFDVEMKDNAVQVGQIVQLTSNAFNDVDGNDYTNKLAEVIKKEPRGAKIKLVVKLLATDEVTTTAEYHARIFTNPLPVKAFSLNEVCVTGLSYITPAGTRTYSVAGGNVEIENVLIAAWDNMYLSQEETALDINGVTHHLPVMMAWAGYPPHPTGVETTNTESWKTTRKYNLYIGVLNEGETAFVTGRPTVDDAHGKWYMAATIPDNKLTDPAAYYKLKYVLPASMLGRNIAFAVYADANLVYDPTKFYLNKLEQFHL